MDNTMSNPFFWKAIYSDGSFLPLFDGEKENKYPDIDRNRLLFFELYLDSKLVIRIHLLDGRRLVFRRRVFKQLNGSEQAVYLVGWQSTVNGVNVQDIAYVFEDGHIDLAGSFDDSSRLFYSVNFLDCEK